MNVLYSLSGYDILAAIVQTVIGIAATGTAVVYLIKRSGNRASNFFFALMILAFAFSIASLVLDHIGATQVFPRLRYVPFWFTWTIGPTWFFYVKFNLFPAYKWRSTDAKHFILPVAQALYYLQIFLFRPDGGPTYMIPGLRYTTVEEAIFVLGTGGYMLAAYRYLRYRAKHIGNQPLRWDFWRVRLLRRSQRVLVALLTFNFVFVAINFFSQQGGSEDLRHVRSFYASSSISFALILLYFMRGVAHRQHFYPVVEPEAFPESAIEPEQRLKLLVKHHFYRDPDLHRVRLARAIEVEPDDLDVLSQKLGAKDWGTLVRKLRINDVARFRREGRSLRDSILLAGYGSKRAALSDFAEGRRSA